MNFKKIWSSIIQIFLSVFLVIWLVGILIQFTDAYPTKDYNILSFYGQIALTLFGITLIGGIFEKKPELSEIQLDLFNTSKIFLTTALCLFFAYGISGILPNTVVNVELINQISAILFVFSLIIGFLLFIVGFISLILILREYRPNITKENK